VQQQANRFTIAFEPIGTPRTPPTAADYHIITMFPVL